MRRGALFVVVAAGLVLYGPGPTLVTAARASVLTIAQPNPTVTPGATNPAVTPSTIQQTICTPGYTTAFRHVSQVQRNQVWAEYQIPADQHRRYVIDHLIALELGGSNDVANLWPQPREEAIEKDHVENELHAQLCAGTLTLATMQQQIVRDWSAPLPR